MSAHNFENNVHQKMEELKLLPSEAVWTNVEGVIRKDKRRRRIIFLFSTLLVLGLAGWLVGSKLSAADKSTNTANHLTTDSKSTFKNTKPSSTDATIHQEGDEATNTDPSHHRKDKATEPVKSGSSKHPQDAITSSADRLSIENKIDSRLVEKAGSDKLNKQRSKLVESAHRTAPKQVNNKIKENIYSSNLDQTLADANTKKGDAAKKSVNETNDKKELIGLTVDESDISQDYETMKSAYPRMMAIANGQTNTSSIDLKDLSQNALSQYTVNNKEIEKNKPTIKSPWHFGINGSVGLSKLVQGGLINTFEKSLVADAAGINTSVGLPGPVNLQSRAPLLSPAAVNAGPAFSIGGFVERKVLKRISISAGLNYTQFSTKSKIGYRVDSSLFLNNFATVGTYNRFYQNTPSRNYFSKYHFIELPVNLQFRLTKPNKLPIFFSGGMSAGYLFNTNALQYDGSYGLYYSENSLFRKWQFGLSTGLSIRLFSASKHPLELGPQMRFNITNNNSSNKSAAEHLVTGGLQLKWYLK